MVASLSVDVGAAWRALGLRPVQFKTTAAAVIVGAFAAWVYRAKNGLAPVAFSTGPGALWRGCCTCQQISWGLLAGHNLVRASDNVVATAD